MRENICYIVGAGDNYGLDFTPTKEDYVIAADGGLTYLQQADIKADLVIGDFDSLAEMPKHPNVIKLKCEKDETDTYEAVQEGMKRGYTTFHIYGGTGGRIEHTVANMQVLAYMAQNKVRGYLFDKDKIITAITDDTIKFDSQHEGYISIFSHSDKATGVFLKGLKYELDNATVFNTFPVGVSNEFAGEESSVTVTEGTLIIILPK